MSRKGSRGRRFTGTSILYGADESAPAGRPGSDCKYGVGSREAQWRCDDGLWTVRRIECDPPSDYSLSGSVKTGIASTGFIITSGSNRSVDFWYWA